MENAKFDTNDQTNADASYESCEAPWGAHNLATPPFGIPLPSEHVEARHRVSQPWQHGQKACANVGDTFYIHQELAVPWKGPKATWCI